MYYLIQSNINSEPEYHKIFEVLEELNLPYERIELRNANEIQVQTDRKDIFVIGSVKLARLAKAKTDWTPGSFYGGNHKFEIHSKYYKENLLNYKTEVCAFGGSFVWKPNESKFIKPYQDAKVFTGKVFTERSWDQFVENNLENPRTPMLHAKTLVQASPPRKIIKEARLWIVGGTIVAGVYYKFHGDVPFASKVAPEGLDFAKSMLDIYSVADAFVMDVCLTTDSWKIVEINCINSAGFYHVDIKALVRAIEVYFD